MPAPVSETAEEKAIRVTISGRVQGVWFRAWTQENAQSLGLFGFVRNRHDGTVDALFKGLPAKVDEMLARCHDGPEMAKVDKVEVSDALGMVPDRFDVKPTV